MARGRLARQRVQPRAALVTRQPGEVAHGGVKARPVAALPREQRLEGRHPLVVGRLQAEAGVVGLRHPAVEAVERRARRGPAGLERGVALAKALHHFVFDSCQRNTGKGFGLFFLINRRQLAALLATGARLSHFAAVAEDLQQSYINSLARGPQA